MQPNPVPPGAGAGEPMAPANPGARGAGSPRWIGALSSPSPSANLAGRSARGVSATLKGHPRRAQALDEEPVLFAALCRGVSPMLQVALLANAGGPSVPAGLETLAAAGWLVGGVLFLAAVAAWLTLRVIPN